MSREKKLDGFCAKRREALRILGEGAGCIAGASVLFSLGCASGDEAIAAVALADLPLGERVRVLDGEHPVELVRTPDGVQARSLWCTHTGCEVFWKPGRQQYVCPCHDGVFDQRGAVIAGPPPAALEAYPIQVTDTTVLLGVKTGDKA